MMRRGGRRATRALGLLLALAASAGLLAPARAAAQKTATQDPDSDPHYESILKDAVAEYNSGDFAEARALFRQANDLHPNARTLRGMGMASFELKEYVDALRSLRAALASKVKPLTAAQRAGAEQLISRAKAFVGRYTLQIVPKDVGATVQVDGAPATIEPDGTLVLNLGRHQLTVTCPTCQPVHRAVEVRGGEEQPLVIQLQQQEPAQTTQTTKPAPAAKPAPPAAVAATAPTATQQSGKASRAAAWWLLGGAGVAAAAALGTGLWWANRNDEIHTCDTGILSGLTCRNRNTLVTQRNLAVGLTAVLGAGAVGLGVAGVVKAARGGDASSKEREEQAGLRCTPSFGGGTCILRF